MRVLAAAAMTAGLVLAGAASAQTWGQPTYGSYGYGYPPGYAGPGTPVSELETRAYVQTGENADGYAHLGYGGYPSAYDYGGPRVPYGDAYRGRGYGYGRYGHRYRRGEAPPRPGYRDGWGYQDDRPYSAWRDGRARGWSGGRDCDCSVPLYD